LPNSLRLVANHASYEFKRQFKPTTIEEGEGGREEGIDIGGEEGREEGRHRHRGRGRGNEGGKERQRGRDGREEWR